MDRPALRSIGVNDFIRWRNDKSLVLSPKFQRRRVWPTKARAYLIDTMVRGLPIPKLYMRQHLDLRSNKSIHEIVDGQQRLSSVLDFYDDLIALPKDEDTEWSGLTYSRLNRDLQRSILTYEFSVDILIDASDADVLDVFARINSYSVPLNQQEKRNAKYFGSFKKAVYSLGFQHLEFWKKHGIFSDSAMARMREAEFTSELLVAMTSGLQDKKGSLDSFYEKWDDRFPYRKKSAERFRDVMDIIGIHVGNTLQTIAFKRSPLFYTLFLVVYELRYAKFGDLASSRRSFNEADGQVLKKALLSLAGC
jgi:uncharacterized protein with ParB-like and HNH nuclease domain